MRERPICEPTTIVIAITTASRTLRIIAAVAATSLLVAACGGGSDSVESSQPGAASTATTAAEPATTAAPTTTAPPTTTAAPTTTAPPTTTAAPTTTAPPTTTAAPTTTAPPTTTAAPSTTAPPTTTAAPELVEHEVVCGEGLVLMEEFITDTDDGCRAEACDHGRTDDGRCMVPEDEVLSDEEIAALPTDTIPYEEYGLEGCSEVSPGMCEDASGTLFCHNTITGWAECPGQPSGDPCEHDASNPLSFAGSVQVTGQIPTVTLEPGVWRVAVCLWGNDIATGSPAPFTVFLGTPPGDDGRIRLPVPTPPFPEWMSGGAWLSVESVISGEWSWHIEAFDPPEPMELSVTPEGAGSWVLTFSGGG